MRIFSVAFLLIFSLTLMGQTTGYMRYDTVKIFKNGGYTELILQNKTKDTLGFLFNTGNGYTQFKRPRQLNDSTIIIGVDTITIRGTGGGTAAGLNKQIIRNVLGVYGASANHTFDDTTFVVKTANSGFKFHEITNDSSYYAIFPHGVTPLINNYALRVKNDGTATHLNSSALTGLAVGGTIRLNATDSGMSLPAPYSYVNMGSTLGYPGHGVRIDSSGKMQFKHLGGSWTNMGGGTDSSAFLTDLLIPSRLEEIIATESDTYQNDDLIGNQIMMLSIEGYQCGFLTRASAMYADFDPDTGTITLTNGLFGVDDLVIIIYRATPIFLLDGSGNYIRDSFGNLIILN